ncbi:hypothetical protein FAZ19_05565 [Sphingobacterium alkalisoli]|uniref:Uncharacterized protein n=1 Tax=Sphingobacterium alkalisoli TaxID=1874115 RepID=A0A4U0HA24_9SPHI|nr:hypothetical protein [Sphingobacterium alkalisoli]TJY68721.1 hypothetical protein FAZ19_05565 [Sphingobacterium alkalisoli]GGH04548.1 hypothetical protein GCM10011418_00270 [Sphingobacterium alkalisoli]
MKSEEFIKSIKVVVSQGAINDVLESLSDPPGRKPNNELVEISNWYNSLDQEGKSFIKKIVEMGVDTSMFGFLCVLDGVRVIESTIDKGNFELYYAKGKSTTLLNDPQEEYLHDIYNAL